MGGGGGGGGVHLLVNGCEEFHVEEGCRRWKP